MSQKQSVKVVIRTRPTPNFCSKNLNIDQINSVSKSTHFGFSHLSVWVAQNIYSNFVFFYAARDSSHP